MPKLTIQHQTTHMADEAVSPRRVDRASRPRPTCILVVSDFEGAALALARLLEREGYLVLTAGSATDALAVAAGLRVDVLVTDVGAPDIDACGLLRRLKDMYGRDLPAVALTGYEEEHYVEECGRAGYSQVLLKPALFPQVLDAVRAAHASRPAARTPQPQT